MYYSSFGLLALVLHIIINKDILQGDKNIVKTEANKRYKHFLAAVMVYYV
ncbi:MAG: hypothetical protein K6G81_03710 [Lachnospiraceae bacterium]|nr:hypothetical protein [Lachnospiraceae bacterium]